MVSKDDSAEGHFVLNDSRLLGLLGLQRSFAIDTKTIPSF